MQARVLGMLLMTTRQSKQTPIPQNIPRGSPSWVVRIADKFSAAKSAATVSPSKAVKRLPFTSTFNFLPLAMFASRGSLPEVDCVISIFCQSTRIKTSKVICMRSCSGKINV